MTPPTHTTAPVQMITRQGLSERWVVSGETLKRKEKAGILPAYKLGRCVRYALVDVERIEAEAKVSRRASEVMGNKIAKCESETEAAKLEQIEKHAEVHEEPAAPKALVPQRDPALEALYAQNRELRRQLAKIGVVT